MNWETSGKFLYVFAFYSKDSKDFGVLLTGWIELRCRKIDILCKTSLAFFSRIPQKWQFRKVVKYVENMHIVCFTISLTTCAKFPLIRLLHWSLLHLSWRLLLSLNLIIDDDGNRRIYEHRSIDWKSGKTNKKKAKSKSDWKIWQKKVEKGSSNRFVGNQITVWDKGRK